ncbi:hypothetical protein HMPREF1624_02839 [Sporothrix schenckii ATCC 58251]|uniref:UDENN domain-containing protein n=2 Tax=Sporothrix schenckii TaxID=29908 RepID=U7Q154_SPOS1|nr:hypothetical protein HMPREF1624_02839 [Sporothrix schenckii ATCC 58251]
MPPEADDHTGGVESGVDVATDAPAPAAVAAPGDAAISTDETVSPVPQPTATATTSANHLQPSVTPIDTTGAAALSTYLPPLTPSASAAPRSPASLAPGFTPLLCVVDFHHARGPEVEMWFGVPLSAEDPAVQYDWPLLPFMALSDGAHASTEDFSYFTLLKPATPDTSSSPSTPATSLFGISCTRQIDAAQLRNRPAEVTRSTVQKAVVVIADSPQFFGMLKERLSIVTKAWFDQREFTDVDILRRFQESLAEEKSRGALGGGGLKSSASGSRSPQLPSDDEDRDQYLGMSLRELVHEFRWQTLVLFKCCLLQPKMLFFGSRCEHLCMIQFSLVSLIPGLLRNLQDCAGPELNSYSEKLTKPTTLRTSDRSSLLTYMGLPLQIFGKGSLFGPYTPLQQLDVLADVGTKSYVVGSTNSLLLQQRDRYSDILINLDDKTVNITSTSLRAALQLSVSDRRWIDFITQEVNDTWDEANPGRPKTMGYVGSEEFIRLQFEEYLLSLISSVKYHNYTTTPNSRTGRVPAPPLQHIEGDPSTDFGVEFVEYWSHTENYKLWSANTDSHIFEFVEPKHPCAGGLSIDDVQRRIAQQVQDLHLDERFAQGREVLGRNIAAGREKASTLFNKLYADMETLRESQRRRAEEARQQQQSEKAQANSNGDHPGVNGGSYPNGEAKHGVVGVGGVDLSKAQQTVQAAGARATAYMSSWASWAGEKRKNTGWGRMSGALSSASNGSATNNGSNSGSNGSGMTSPAVGGSGSWSLLGSARRGNRNTMSSTTSDASSERGLRMSVSSFMTGTSDTNDKVLPATPSVHTPATFTSASGRSMSGHDSLHDFPPDLIVRNLDEERPIRPPPKDLPPKDLPPKDVPPKDIAPREVLFSSPDDSTADVTTNGTSENVQGQDAKDASPPPPEPPKEAQAEFEQVSLVEKSEDETTEKKQEPVSKHAPSRSVGSKVMLLP